MPTVSPLGPTSRTSGTRIRSLIRSSVLMCPPVGSVGRKTVPASRRPGPEMQKRLPLDQAEASRDTRHRAHASCARPEPSDRTRRPVLRAVDAGGRRVLPDLRLSDRRGLPEVSELIGQRTMLSEHSAGAALITGATQPTRSPTRASGQPAASARRSSPSTANRDRPGDVDHQRVGALLDAPTAPPCAVGTGDRRASGSQRGQRSSVLVNASSACRPSAPLQQHGRHVAGLVVGQAVRRRLDLAEDRDHRHQQPGGAERGQHVRRSAVSSAAYPASAAAEPSASASPVSSG